VCRDLATDNANCGGCGKACVDGACLAGTCKPFCSTGLKYCGGVCADLNTDTANCGECSKGCGGKGCVAGSCTTGFGSCKDGALVVFADTTLNLPAANIIGTKGTTSLTLVLATAGFNPGATLFLHQTQSSDALVGQNEYAEVASVSGATLTLKRPLAHAYFSGATARAQAIVVPQYLSISIASEINLTGPAWNGDTGGILVFDVCGAVKIEGAVSMAGRGFQNRQRVCGVTCDSGLQGESSRGRGQVLALANGAGGGGATGGRACAGGGGGGHAIAGIAGSDCTNGGNCHWGNCPGGAGGTSVALGPFAVSALFGAAGGEGGSGREPAIPGGGGTGGGLVVVRADSFTGGGALRVDGQNGATGSTCGNGCGQGGGGGGAAGTLLLEAAAKIEMQGGTVSAVGGAGGPCSCPGAGYFGGAGSRGRIGIKAPSVTVTAVPGYIPY
jgi:hypothetical protein